MNSISEIIGYEVIPRVRSIFCGQNHDPYNPDELPKVKMVVFKHRLTFQEDKLRTMDPKKAAAVERLGMGVSAATNSKQSARFTHSAITEINTIEQEEPSGGGRGSQGRVH